ncbi:MAG: hypothetical protein AAFZ65_01950 [Planctomycetota bacterium]
MPALPSVARPTLLFGALVLTLSSATAQEVDTPEPAGGGAVPGARAVDLERSMADFRARTSAPWRMRRDAQTGYADFVYGGALRAGFRPRTDADYASLARTFLREAREVMGIDPASLGAPEVSVLPPSLGGGSDKVAVSFEQQVGGVRVHRGHVNVLMSFDGDLLALDSRGLPELEQVDTRPATPLALARATAVGAFLQRNGEAPTAVSEPRLTIEQVQVEKRRRATLAWELDVRFVDSDSGLELARRYAIAADGNPRLLRDEDLIHFFDVGGQVLANVSPGTLPDLASNPEAAEPAAYLRVTSSAGTTTTDENGFFNFPGVDGPLDLTFEFEGLYNDVANDQGPQHVINQTLNGTGNTVLMNPNSQPQITSQANVFVTLNNMRDWIRSIDPNDASMDFVNTSEVNENFVDFGGGFIIDSCNAFYNGSSTNYFLPGGGCPNTAYSTVIAHEQGHWLNDRYSSGNGPDGFGEGNADVFAMYLFDTPIVGASFSGGGFIRSGENTLPYCGDGNGGCYGAVHLDGQVHMGAMWKMRRNLQNQHGAALGGLIADQLFSAWMNTYDQGQIDSVIEIQLLTLDDDDGDLGNGTPNFEAIDSAFREQGFPGVELDLIELANAIPFEDTLDEVGPYGVAVDASSLIGETIASVRVRYDAGNGEQVLPMASGDGLTYTALLPGLPSPTEVSYVIEAVDSANNLETWPAEGAARFAIGDLRLHFADDFEGPTDNGWVHQELATQDDWQRGVPEGRSGTSQGVAWSDPAQAASGLNVWGNDLGPDGFNGAYQPNVLNLLRSPAIDLSDAVGARLRFQRWLTVEEAAFDQAQIRVNGNLEWQNPNNGNLIDTAWTPFELDLSAYDGDPAAELEFRLDTDGGLNLGGWNIDDLRVFSLIASPTSGLPQSYGSGVAGAFGEPLLDSRGQPATLGNPDFGLAVKNGLPNGSVILVAGVEPAAIPLAVGDLLVTPILVEDLSLDLFGQLDVALPLSNNPALQGATLYVQAFIDDPSAPAGFAITRGLAATFGN